MTKLTDPEIRAALLERLRKLPTPPRAVLEEVRVHNGNAVADVVTVHRGAHCYEIKGATDSLQRITAQGAFYDQAFQRITLVTTPNHLSHATRRSPAYWGVMVASSCPREGVLRFRYVRRASDSPRYNKQVALLTLWRSELLRVCAEDESRAQKLNRAGLTQLIATKCAARDVDAMIGQMLVSRHATSGWSVAM